MANCLFCKFLAYRRIPLRQQNNLRRSGLKIKRNLAPFAVVVHLVEVDSGGDWSFARCEDIMMTTKTGPIFCTMPAMCSLSQRRKRLIHKEL